MLAWFRSRRALTGHLAEQTVVIEDLSNENDALQRQLSTARLEAVLVKTERDALRAELDAIKADPIHVQLELVAQRASTLEARLREMQQDPGLALERRFS